MTVRVAGGNRERHMTKSCPNGLLSAAVSGEDVIASRVGDEGARR